MKKLFLLVYFASIAAFIGYSQSLSLTDSLGNPIANNGFITKTGLPEADEMVAYAFVKNNTHNPVSVKVRKVEISLVDGSINMFCWGLCFAPGVYESPDPKVIEGDSTNKVDFSGHYVPGGNKGVSVIRYVFFNTENPSDTVCLNVNYSAYPLGVESSKGAPVLSNAYPNPANGHVSFNVAVPEGENSLMVIRNMLGSEVREMAVTGRDKITFETAGLPVGIYFCALLVNGESKAVRKFVVRH
jgi:hypothetical protein